MLPTLFRDYWDNSATMDETGDRLLSAFEHKLWRHITTGSYGHDEMVQGIMAVNLKVSNVHAMKKKRKKKKKKGRERKKRGWLAYISGSKCGILVWGLARLFRVLLSTRRKMPHTPFHWFGEKVFAVSDRGVLRGPEDRGTKRR
jgi:hypothetical protein